MRLAVCALSAVMLSGCSWLGGFGGGSQGGSIFGNSSQYGANNGSYRFDQHNPCVIPSPRAPIPRGCNPANVTIGTASGGFPQQPNFGNPQYADAGFGSHAGVAGQQSAYYQPRKRLKKPKYRGSLSLGLEKSISGDLLDAFDTGIGSVYDPQLFNQREITGSAASGNVTTTTYTANAENLGLDNDPSTFNDPIFTPRRFNRTDSRPVDFNDVYSTPIRLAGGVEYIVNPNTTVFANAGYSHSDGEGVEPISFNGSIYRLESSQDFIADPASPGNFIESSAPPIENLRELDPQVINTVSLQFSDLKRVDFEIGGRRYFEPIVRDQGFKTLTPFIGASIGASYYDDVSIDITEAQTDYEAAFNGDGDPRVSAAAPVGVDLFDSQWVPSGQLNAGVEWQVTPKTALAFESGLKFEGSLDFLNGEDSDTNIIIPVTVRGSYNF